MSITARPGAGLIALLTDAPSGLLGTLTVAIRELPDNTVVQVASTAQIGEFPQAGGRSNYEAIRTAPDAPGEYEIVWWDGTSEITEPLVVEGDTPGLIAGSAHTFVLTGAPHGLAGTLTLAIRALPEGTVVEVASAAGITEYVVGAASNYAAERPLPSVAGSYEAVWFDGVATTTESFDVAAGHTWPADAVPDVSDVSAILQERVKGQGGNVVTDFGPTTRPTAAQVERIIDLQAPLVLVEFGDLSDAALICSKAGDIRAAVRMLVAARVAAVVELSFWPQDTVGQDTAENFWRRVVEIDTPKVVAAARECRLGDVVPGGDGGAGGGVAMRPAFSFNSGPRVGNRPF